MCNNSIELKKMLITSPNRIRRADKSEYTPGFFEPNGIKITSRRN